MKKEDERIAKIFQDILKFKQRKYSTSLSISEKEDESDALPPVLTRMIKELQAYVSVKQKNTQQYKNKNAVLQQEKVNLKSQLQAVNKELEMLSYSVSHDLRAPLRAVDGYTKILEEDYKDTFDEEAKRLLSNIQYNTKKMSDLIDNVLIFSRIGNKELNKIRIDMDFLVDCAITEVNKTTPHNAKIKVKELIPSEGDYGMIQTVFINLISNAVKFSMKEKEPLIEISSVLNGSEVIYTVKDNGVGFNMKYIDKLFGVFQRLHTPEEFEGAGMGLAIAQRIMHKHSGRIWAESEAGKGTSFSFALPYRPVK